MAYTEKYFLLSIVIAALLAISFDTNTREFVDVDNTNLAPQPYGNGMRTHNVTYWTNDSAIRLMVILHSDQSIPQINLDMNLSVDSKEVINIDTQTGTGSTQHEHLSIYAEIPRGHSYKIRNSTLTQAIYIGNWTEWKVYD